MFDTYNQIPKPVQLTEEVDSGCTFCIACGAVEDLPDGWDCANWDCKKCGGIMSTIGMTVAANAGFIKEKERDDALQPR